MPLNCDFSVKCGRNHECLVMILRAGEIHNLGGSARSHRGLNSAFNLIWCHTGGGLSRFKKLSKRFQGFA